ncbi:MAG: hypothetical protein J5952_06240 [Prevotella sp.]|nr:hypothetical protein [Prevotella sp.]
MTKFIQKLVAVVLLCAGLAACGDRKESNPLGIQAPEWQQFAHPKGERISLYKEAKEDSPVLKTAIASDNGDYFEARIFWSDEEAPRGWYTEKWIANEHDALPILGEEGEFYKVYVFNETLGAKEAYVKKADCEAVKPVTLTQKLIDSIGMVEGRCDNIVKEGELQNLCFSSFQVDYDEEPYIMMGQLIGDCIVYPNASIVTLHVTSEKAPITFAKAEGGDGFILNCGEDQLWQPDPSQASILDTRKLSNEQMQQMYNDLKVDGAKLQEVLYYIPEVNKERFIHIYIFPTDDGSKGEESVSASAEAQVNNDDPETVTRQIIERAMARDAEGLGELMTGTPQEIQGASNLLMLAFSEVKGYNITKCEINGNRARVRYTVKFKYDTQKDKFDLVRTDDGSWKLVAKENNTIKVM